MPTKTQKYPIFNSDKELSDFLLNNLTDSLKQSIKITTSIMVKAEMENLRKEVKEHLQFNGYYDRNMISTLGKIEGIQIPRWRQTPPIGQNLKSFSVFDQQNSSLKTLWPKCTAWASLPEKLIKSAAPCLELRSVKIKLA